MKEWSLDALYRGYQDENFHKDIKALETVVNKINTFAKHLDTTNECATCVEIIQLREEMTLLMMKLYEYLNLRQSADTRDSETVSYLEQVVTISNHCSKAQASFDRFIVEMKDLDGAIAQDELLKTYTYYLHEIKKDGHHLLSDDVEEVISKMDMSGGSGWESMQSYLTSTLTVDYQGEKTTLSAIRNLAYDGDREVRKTAYEAELAAYDNIKDAIAFSLNNIKAQVNTVAELRGFEGPLEMALYQSKMKKETLEVMLSAMEDYMPIFHAYLKRKAKLLGYSNGLPWYELFAPLGHDHHKYSIEEAKDILLKQFTPFAEDMGAMMKQAFDEEWIDFYPRSGKVGGAFCANLPFIKASRILTNYDGALGDIVTLAHELGHAYHGMMIEDHRILNTDYSMPVAESASTFNENIIMNTLIEEAQGEQKMILIENQLQDLTQIMCDIYSRYLFEKEVFDRRRKGFMFADELEKIMLESQRKAYGDGLDPNYLHPYMWICKSHYYSSGLSFYNYPYAFGGLFARGLIVKYQEEGASFVPKYRTLLHNTTISSVEDAAKIANIDLTDKAFWVSALETCKERIEEFLALTKNK